MKPKKISPPSSTGRTVPAPTPEQIEALAHAIWIDRGRLEGRALEDWLEAERQLRGVGSGAAPATQAAPLAGSLTSEADDDTEVDPDRAPAARIDRKLDEMVSPPAPRSPTSL